MAISENKRRTCATMDVHHRLLEQYPEYRKRRIELERFTKFYQTYNERSGLRTAITKIPVVVHVVYNTPAQNISDAQIHSQIDVLNRDYRALNPDVASVPSAFAPFVADCRVEFGLAVRDPSCAATTGITRTSTSKTSFPHDDTMKHASTGGADAWPADRYLNLWVCPLSGGLLGYAQFPGGPVDTDGVVIDVSAFGTTGTAAPPYNLGRTATHEIGHWLNLLHIWGDDGGACTGSDEVADTPNQADMNFGAPAFPHVTCSNGPNGDMFMNYMDYTDDAAMFMFTAGQSVRMDAALAGPRTGILSSDGLVAAAGSFAADLWSADAGDDTGLEPDPSAAPMWQSNDIWVRKQNDGFVNQDHQNPEFREPGFGSNYVYVRVRNRSCSIAGSGNVKLFWAKASLGLGWPAPFDGSVTTPALMGGLIDTQPTGSVAGRGSTILEFPWYPPDPADYAVFGSDQGHFCLLSRIETSTAAPYGMTFPETGDLYANVQKNNNIVWKNITVVDEFPGAGRMASVLVGNFTEKPHVIKLTFTAPEKRPEHNLFQWGRVTVDLDRKLFELWKHGGSQGSGIEAAGESRLVLTSPKAWIGNITVPPREFHNVRAHFVPGKEQHRTAIFFLDLKQFKVEGKKEQIIGGQRFVLKTLAHVERECGTQPVKVFNGAEWLPVRPQALAAVATIPLVKAG